MGTWSTGTTMAVASITAASGDVLLVWVVTYKSASSVTVSSMGAVTGVTWDGAALESITSCTSTQETTETLWKGITTGALSAATETITLSTTPTAAHAYVMSIKGAAVSSPNDPNANYLVTGVSACSSTAAAPTATTQSTSNPDDLIVNFYGGYTSATETAGAIAGTTATLDLATLGTGSSISDEYRSLSATTSATSCAFGTTTTYWRDTCIAITADYKGAIAGSMTLAPVPKAGPATGLAGSMTLTSSLKAGPSDGIAESMSLSPVLTVAAVLSAAEAISMTLVSAVNQATGLARSLSITLLAAIGDGLAGGLAGSMSLSPAINQGIGIAESASMSLTASLETLEAFFTSLSASMSITPALGQSIGSTTASSMSLISALNQGLNGVEAESMSLLASLATNQGFSEAIAAAMSLGASAGAGAGSAVAGVMSVASSVNQGITAVAGLVSSTLTPVLGQGLASILIQSNLSLTTGLSVISRALVNVADSVVYGNALVLNAVQNVIQSIIGGGNSGSSGAGIVYSVPTITSAACQTNNAQWDSLHQQLSFAVVTSGPCTVQVNQANLGSPYYVVVGGKVEAVGMGWSSSFSVLSLTVSQNAPVMVSWSPLGLGGTGSQTSTSTSSLNPLSLTAVEGSLNGTFFVPIVQMLLILLLLVAAVELARQEREWTGIFVGLVATYALFDALLYDSGQIVLLPSAGRLAFIDSVTILVALGGQAQFLIVLAEIAAMVLLFLQASGKLDDWLTRAG